MSTTAMAEPIAAPNIDTPTGSAAKQRTPRKEPKLLAVSDVATILGYKNARNVRQLIDSGQLPAVRMPDSKEWGIDERAVRAFKRKPRGHPRRISEALWKKIEHAVLVDRDSVRVVATREGVNVVTIHRHLKKFRAPGSTTSSGE